MPTIKDSIEDFFENNVWREESMIECAEVECSNDGNEYYDNKFVIHCVLKTEFTSKEYNDFLNQIDFDYSDFEFINGTIWFSEGSWVSFEAPEIPFGCKRSD